MLSTLALLAIAAVTTTAAPSPDLTLSFNTGGPIQPCTTTILQEPSVDTDFTFQSETCTATASIDCGGCVLETKYLGVGLPCQTVTTVPGTTTTTVKSCTASAT